MRGIRGTLICALLTLTFAVSVSAQISPGITDEDRAEFARHRAALFAKMGDETAVLFGAYRGYGGRFAQESNFWYLTGVEIPMAALILDGRTDEAILFLAPEREGRAAIYNGKTIGPGPAAVAEFGIANTQPIADLASVLKSHVPEGAAVWTLVGREFPRGGINLPWARTPSSNTLTKEWLAEVVPGAEVKDITPAIHELRVAKTPWEIARMDESIRIAGEAHVASFKASHPGITEAEIEGICAAVYLKNGALQYGYTAIVGAGPNSCIMHYPDSSGTAKDGDLILMDFGPSYRYYVADITRTWPASGKFTAEQRKVYLDVLEIELKLIDFIKPGVSIDDIYAEHKRLSTEAGYGPEIYVHGPCHFVGIDVHDPGDTSKPLVPGAIVTIEPGAYFPEKGWGIRIEDDILVTEDGNRNLSASIPKHPDEIEAIMAK